MVWQNFSFIKIRKWNTSYTKRVVDSLVAEYPISAAVKGNPVYAAIQLLILYHRDLHLPYEQRDEARANNERLGARVVEMDAELIRLRASVAAARPFQEFMACRHYPDALFNFWKGRDHCEHCCETEPLKWFDNGRHREPGK